LSLPAGKELMVHSGFLAAVSWAALARLRPTHMQHTPTCLHAHAPTNTRAQYDSIKAKLRRIVDLLTRDRSAEQPWTVFLTGHSLGGALATLAAYEQAGRRCVSLMCVCVRVALCVCGRGGAVAPALRATAGRLGSPHALARCC
jgi:alpha-beta hydrolase superfamily lysophospholipase